MSWCVSFCGVFKRHPLRCVSFSGVFYHHHGVSSWCVSFCGVFKRHPLRCDLKYGFRPWLLLSNCQNHHKPCQLGVRQVKVTFAVSTLVQRRKYQWRLRADWNQQSICSLLLSFNLSSPCCAKSTQIGFNVTVG